jgi:hypothetical protein
MWCPQAIETNSLVATKDFAGDQMKRNPHLWNIAYILVAMIALASVLVYGVIDSEGFEIARYRNALIAEAGVEADFQWTPTTRPHDYLQERISVPNEIARWPAISVTGNTMNRALAIAKSLTAKPRTGGQIGRSVIATLQLIESTGGGYCVDFAQVFSALAYASGIEGRVWAISFDGFGGRGHVFNEIWDADNQTWVMIDAFNGFYSRDINSGKPLSTLEFRRRLLAGQETVRWERISPEFFGFKDEATAFDYYRRGFEQLSMWWGNNFLSYDENPSVSMMRKFGRLSERTASIITGVLPKLKMFVTDANREAFDSLMWIRTKIIGSIILEFCLMILILRELLQWRASKDKSLRRTAMLKRSAIAPLVAALASSLLLPKMVLAQIRTLGNHHEELSVVRVQGSSPGSGLDYFTAKMEPEGENGIKQLLRNVETFHLDKRLLQNIADGRYDVALADLDFVLKYFPNHPGALQMLTTVAALSKKTAIAVKYFEIALALYPNYAITHAQYGRLFMVLGDLNVAIKKFEQAIQMDPKLTAGYELLALAYEKKGDVKSARETRERAKEVASKGASSGESPK